jgi:thioredoxin 1
MEQLNVITFVADWCETCRKVIPSLKELESQYQNLDWENLDPDTVGMEYSLSAVPTVIFTKDGVELERVIGERPKVIYEQLIQKYS